MTTSEVSGPPVISVGSSEVASRTIRGTLQGGIGYFLCEGIEAFHLYDFDDRQWAWATVALGFAVTYVQNAVESRRGRRLIGASSA